MEKLKPSEGLVESSSPVLESVAEVNNVDHSSISSSHDTIFVGNMDVPILGTALRLPTNMGYKGGGLGINGK